MMRKILLLILMCSLFSMVNAQPMPATTEEEFNMASVGYKMYLQMGVELKKGYKVNDIAEYEYAERKATFKGLFRPGDQKPCAIIMIYSKSRGAPEYYCMPTPDAPEIFWDRFRTSLAGETDNRQEQLQFFSFAMAKAIMFYATK
jgi:hypothetical protein